MTKKKEPESTALVAIEDSAFPVLTIDNPESVARTLVEMGISRFDLDKVTVPLGGAIAFEIETLTDVEYVKEILAIVAYQQSRQRTWFRIPVEESDGVKSPPTCSSEDGITGFGSRSLEGPEEGEVEEVGEFECATCPYNVWGSKRNAPGQKSKDCGERISLYCFNEESMIPFIIQVPSASLKNARKYVLKLLGRGRAPSSLVTRFTVKREDNPAPHGVIEFAVAGELSDAAKKRMKAIGEDLRTAFAVTGRAPTARSVETEEID